MCKMGSKVTIDSNIVKEDRMLQITNQMKESNNASKPAFEYLNYRCKKCGKYVSRKSKIGINMPPMYLLCGKGFHDCAEGLNDDEKAWLDLVSVSSEHPIGELV